MTISANFEGLWGDNYAKFCLANFLQRHVHIWSKTNHVICFWVGDDFITNITI